MRLWVLLPFPLGVFGEYNVCVAVFRTAVDLVPLRDSHDETIDWKYIVVRRTQAGLFPRRFRIVSISRSFKSGEKCVLE